MEIVKSNPKTQTYQLIADTISEAGEAMTLLEINSRLGMNLKSGSITGAIRAGYIAKVGESKVARETSAKVAVYKFVNANVNSNKKGQPYNYSDLDRQILDYAADVDSFTSDAISAAMDTKLPANALSVLVRKGNLAKVGETTVTRMATSKVGLYDIVEK